jgi:hypothetical protein
VYPVDPNFDSLVDRWRPVIQPRVPPSSAIAALQEVRPHRYIPGMYGPYRVVTVWAMDDAEIVNLEEQIRRWREGLGPAPHVSVMAHVSEAPLQTIRLTVGEFSEPYRRTDRADAGSSSGLAEHQVRRAG